MHGQLKWRVKDTQDDVVGEPNDKQPARPVAAAEQAYSTKHRQKPDAANPDHVGCKRTLCFELGGVVGKKPKSRSGFKAGK